MKKKITKIAGITLLNIIAFIACGIFCFFLSVPLTVQMMSNETGLAAIFVIPIFVAIFGIIGFFVGGFIGMIIINILLIIANRYLKKRKK